MAECVMLGTTRNRLGKGGEAMKRKRKFDLIPKAVLSGYYDDPVGEQIEREMERMRGRGTAADGMEVLDVKDMDTIQTAQTLCKPAWIPPAVVSAQEDGLRLLMKDLTSREPLYKNDDGTLSVIPKNHAGVDISGGMRSVPSVPSTVIPKAIVSSGQWYETKTGKELKQAEIEAVKRAFGSKLTPQYLPDGRMCWRLVAKPNIGDRFKTMTYHMLLAYDSDHPQSRFGSSVKCYLESPTIDELQQIVNKLSIYPKIIPHVLRDSSGKRYLCSSDKTDNHSSLSEGITSAVTSYLYAYRWLTIFEAGLRYPPLWEAFQQHGRV